MSTEVYIVTEGEYSDYQIVDVFLDKEKAEYFARFHTHDGRVETYYTADDDYIIDIRTIQYYIISLNNKGMVTNCEIKTEEYCAEDEPFKESFKLNYRNGFICTVIADSEEQAIKIAQDKRAQWLAEKYGI